MGIKISKEVIMLLFEKISLLLTNLLPGMVIMELFFKKGYFSKQPESIIEFVLYILWCIVFSVPYNFIYPTSIELWYKRVKTHTDNKIVKDEPSTNFSESFEFGFVILKIILTYLIFKFINFLPLGNFLDNSKNIKLFLTIIIMTILSYPFGCLYSCVMRCMFDRFLESYKKCDN